MTAEELDNISRATAKVDHTLAMTLEDFRALEPHIASDGIELLYEAGVDMGWHNSWQ